MIECSPNESAVVNNKLYAIDLQPSIYSFLWILWTFSSSASLNRGGCRLQVQCSLDSRNQSVPSPAVIHEFPRCREFFAISVFFHLEFPFAFVFTRLLFTSSHDPRKRIRTNKAIRRVSFISWNSKILRSKQRWHRLEIIDAEISLPCQSFTRNNSEWTNPPIENLAGGENTQVTLRNQIELSIDL